MIQELGKWGRVIAGCLLVFALCAAAVTAHAGDSAPPYAASAEKRAAASEALKEIDVLLKQASEITGLPIRRSVKSAISTKEEVQRYIRQRVIETSGSRQSRAQELALKKFGLLPADFELEDALVKLLAEQAAAYYDPRRKQIYIADWTPVTMQRPAIIHELTHALQDQQVDLDQFLDEKKLNDDEQMARVSVVEGGAVLVMMEYMLSSTGLKIEAIPNLEETVREATVAEINKFPVYAAAPLYLRETLLFPYTAGMQYVRVQIEKQGKSAYAAALKNPPRSTAEVMHPDREVKLAGAELRPPEVTPLPAGYSLLGDGVLTELDLQILLKQYAGEETAREIAPNWRGFRYAIYENGKNHAAFLVHRSRWADGKAATDFADAYRKVLAGKGEKDAQLLVESDTVTVKEGVPGTGASQ